MPDDALQSDDANDDDQDSNDEDTIVNGSSSEDSGDESDGGDSSSDSNSDGWSKYQRSSLPTTFDRDEGPFILFESDAKSLDYFSSTFPQSIWNMLVVETNRYAFFFFFFFAVRSRCDL